MASALVIDDDTKLAHLVAEFLTNEGFTTTLEHNGSNAPERILTDKPDVVILDVMLPGLDGFEICKQVRDHFPGLIVMLTARGEEIDEVLGLELGADDYMAKPVRPRALLARIRTLLRRPTPPPPTLNTGPIHIDPTTRKVTLNDTEIELTTGEFELLHYLAQHPGQTIHRDDLYRELRGIEYDGLDRAIDLSVARLRKKLHDDAKHPKLIKSIRGIGYIFTPNNAAST